MRWRMYVRTSPASMGLSCVQGLQVPCGRQNTVMQGRMNLLVGIVGVAIIVPPARAINDEDYEYLADLVAQSRDRDFGQTWEAKWTLSWYDQWNEGLVERYITRAAGDSLLQSNFGNENGHHRALFRQAIADNEHSENNRDSGSAAFDRPPEGLSREDALLLQIPPDKLAGTINMMIFQGKVWRPDGVQKSAILTGSVETIVPAKLQQHLPVDFATIGFAVAPYLRYSVVGLDPWDFEGFDSAPLERSRSGDLEIVVASYDTRRVEWYLDPAQENLPVAAMLYRNDELVLRSETEYEVYEGRRLPLSVHFYEGWAQTPYRVLDVQEVTFDKPWHARGFTPADIGIVFGTQLRSSEADGFMYRWDGLNLIGSSEYDDLVDLYGVDPDPRFVERIAAGFRMTIAEWNAWTERTRKWRREQYFAEHGTRPWLDEVVLLQKPGEKDEWDVYVEKFIEKHKLTGEKRKRAKDILERSKKIRDARLRKDAAKIKQAKRENNKKKLAYYEGIIKRIFDDVLVRSLSRLLPKDE